MCLFGMLCISPRQKNSAGDNTDAVGEMVHTATVGSHELSDQTAQQLNIQIYGMKGKRLHKSYLHNSVPGQAKSLECKDQI